MDKRLKKSPITVQPRTKEQIERDTEIARKRKIVVTQFYPALVEATSSVDEAKMLLQSIASLTMEEVLNTMKERKFTEILDRVLKKLTPDDIRLLQVEKLLETMRYENLFVAREIVEGMQRAISQMQHDEDKARPLDALKPDWDRYLN